MTMSAFDLAVSFGVVAVMPWIIWANYRIREGGLSGYLWREHPMLVWAALAFLSLMLLFNVIELLTHFGLIPLETEEVLSMALGIPMVGLSIFIILFGSAAAVAFLRARQSRSEN
jgi:hypothetical protein